VMRCAGDRPPGLRTRALIVLLWRAGLRINEALALAESDLDPARGSILIRPGKGGRRRRVGMNSLGGSSSNPGSRSALACRSARCSASCPA
jgi:site-specific recombinase XerD